MEYEINTNGGVEFDGVGAEEGGIEGDPYWGNGPNDAIWATEEDYEIASAQGYNRGSDGAWGGGPEYTRGRHGEPPSKKSKGGSHSDSARNRNGGYQGEFGQGGSSGTPPPPLNSNAREGSSSGGSSSGRGKGTGRMFFKTKLCCKFRQGICPFSSNCNFAHGMEELRKPPPNWQEIVAQQEERERRAENQIPCVVSTSDGAGEMQRYHKTRLCKKFYTEEGCPYGERCNFVHDDQWRSRESVTISLGPTPTAGNGSAAVNGNNAANGSFQRPSNWKTRICNKWETTGHCPFGEKCHFAHGLAELQKYGGGLPDAEAIDASASLRNDAKQNGSASKAHVEAVAGQASSLFNSENYVIGSSARTIGNILSQRSGQRIMPKWKGPDKISRIYGDWIEDNEWEFLSKPALQQFDRANNGDEEVLNEV